MRATFVLSEMVIGLRRNLTMTLAVIITVAISLTLFGAGLLVRQQVNAMKDFWYDKVEVSIFLADGITDQQRQQLLTELQTMPEVEEVFYESKEEAYQHFREQFEDSPDLVRNVNQDALPESFRVKLVDPEQYQVVSDAFIAAPGVDEVRDQREVLDRFFNVLNVFQYAALVIAAAQIVAATLLIANTIRVAAFSRRRETGIMRLVGASKLYIQLPFLLEGALAGLVGAVIAIGGLLAIKVWFVDDRLRDNIGTIIPFIGWDEVWAVVPIVLVTGVALSALASFVTLRRHLRV